MIEKPGRRPQVNAETGDRLIYLLTSEPVRAEAENVGNQTGRQDVFWHGTPENGFSNE